MCARKRSFLCLPVILLGLILLMATTPGVAHADEPFPPSNQGTCINCHEDLYFLHDTGKWFCLKDTPMACVDCHGGDQTATTQEKAHANRAAYPVINENVAKCQECHPEKSIERMQIFREVAGISPVMVAAAYVPGIAVAESPLVPVTGQEQPFPFVLWQESLKLIVLLALVLAAVLISRHRHGEEPKR